MQFDKVTSLLAKIEDMQQSECFGQMTIFIEPGTYGVAFNQSYLYKNCPPEIRKAADLLASHFKSSKIELRCDSKGETPNRFVVLRFNP